MEIIDRNDLLERARKSRAARLEQLKKRIDGFVAAGGEISCDCAREAIQDCVRFAAQVASVQDLEDFRPAA